MEKWIPHCKLSVVKALVEVGKVRATVMALTPQDFHKGMTTHADHRIWQDVYRPRHGGR